jgi:hypothetical protein
MLDGTTYGLVAALVLLHLVTLGYAYHRRAGGDGGEGADRAEETRSVPDRPVPGEFDADTPTVSCDVCGTENAAEYSFCRACVSELPLRTTTAEAEAGMFRSGSA